MEAVNVFCVVASNKYNFRGPLVIFSGLISLTSYGLWLGSTTLQMSYAAVYLQIIGAYLAAPTIYVW